jgi:hypothetical protein
MTHAIDRRLARLERLADPETRDTITLRLILRNGEDRAARITEARAEWERKHGRVIDVRDPVVVLSVNLPAKCASMSEWLLRYAPAVGAA